MSRCNPIIWYDNIPIDEELLSDTIDIIISGDQEFRGGDNYYTSYFINSNNGNGADSIFQGYYNNIVDRVLVDLGLYHRSNCKVGTWMQVYTTGQNMRIHDHYGGGELVSFVHFVQPIDSKVFYFYDSNNNKIYPDEQKKNDFIVFPPWLQHGVDNNKTTDRRAIISGNVMLNMMYKNQNRDYTKIHYTERVDGGESLLIDGGKNPEYVEHKQRHSELDSL